MMMQGHTALVIGDESELGQVVAQAFAAQGATVYMAVSQANTGTTLEGVSVLPVDLLDEFSIEMAIRTTKPLNYAVNLIVMPQETLLIAELDYCQWTAFIERYLRSTFLCIKHEIHAMLPDGGAIVNVTRYLGDASEPLGGCAATVQDGILGLVRSSALGYAGNGVRVNVLRANTASTALTIAEFAKWLCSDAASYITGQDASIG